MSNDDFSGGISSTPVSLIVRRRIRATPERLFEVWTQPEHLKKWWGPAPVKCVDAEIDLRVGGHYRIVNQFPDGRLLTIMGHFELVDPPFKLAYTWRTKRDSRSERVTVRFEPRNDLTDVVVVHERIADKVTRDLHERGWLGCLDGLVQYVNSG